MMDRQTKTFIAVFLLMAATLLTISHLVNRDPIADWWLAGGLAILSVVFWVWTPGTTSTADADATALSIPEQASGLPKAQEWIISKDVIAETPILSHTQPAADADIVEQAPPEAAPIVEEAPIEPEPEPMPVVAVVEEAPIEPEPEAAPVVAVVEEAPIEPEPEAEPVAGGVEEASIEPEPEAEPVAGGVEEAPIEPEPEAASVAGSVEEAPVEPEPEAEPETISAVEPAAGAEVPPADGEIIDDLTLVEGIGPKYRDALMAAGITTFEQVAGLSEERIIEIAQQAGMRRTASMGTWAEQAQLAAADDWDALNALKKKLNAGRR